MEEKLISIIVPVYDVEKYIDRCLYSLVEQSYKNIQILVINDGTRDNSMSIVNAYSKKDSRIEIYNKENGGLSDARNFAFDYVNGQFICFVDSDDWVEKDYIQKLVQQFDIDSEIDISMLDFDYCYDAQIKNREYKLRDVVLEQSDALMKLCKGKEITNHVWNKMYKRKLFEKIRFEKGRKYEDIYIMHLLFGSSRKISCSSFIGYHYYMREGSIMHENNPQNDMDIFIGYKNRYEFIRDAELKHIVLKFCAWACYKVLFLHDESSMNANDIYVARVFWREHREISNLGIKYFFMYQMPHIYRILINRG